MKKINVSICVFVFSIALVLFGMKIFADVGNDQGFSYLVVGLDDSNKNTDVICILNFSKSQGKISLFQVPRDTFYLGGGTLNKVNGLYPTFIKSGENSKQALKHLRNEISSTLSVDLNGSISVTTSAFEQIIDSINGIYICAEEGYSGNDNKCKKYNGKEALEFVRARKDYVTGDLGRLDAHTAFWHALFRAFKNVSVPELFFKLKNVSGIEYEGAIVDTLMYFANLHLSDSVELDCVRLPGESILLENKISYFVINKNKTISQLSNSFSINIEKFDAKEKLFDKNSSVTRKIYYS